MADVRELAKDWQRLFEGKGFSPEQSRKMAEVAMGPAAASELRESQAKANGASDLAASYGSYFESRGFGDLSEAAAKHAARADRYLEA